MSAIFGILRFDGSEVSAGDLERLGNTMAHRGPDGHKFVVDGQVGLGHCLMRVNREDAFEAQPLIDREAGLTLVVDCRIDNREELAEALELSAAHIRDLPDSAFILHAYKKWGEDCAEHLLGDFAFAVWDSRARKLVLARDHVGQRAVQYHANDRFIAFATEIKALHAVPEVPRRISDVAIAKRLTCHFAPRHDGQTMYEDIFGVQGATVVTVGADGTIASRRYWTPHADPRHEHRNEAYYVETYRKILAEAVACRIRRLQTPPSMCFGGGFDSTAMAGLTRPEMIAQGRRLIAVCSAMPKDYKGPQRHARKWGELCARHLPHVDMRFVERNGKTMLTEKEALFEASETFVNFSTFMYVEIFAAARQDGARLLLDGHGGDYTVNPRGFGALHHFLRSGQLRYFAREFRPHMKATGKSLPAMVRGAVYALLPYWVRKLIAAFRRGFCPPEYDGAIRRSFADTLRMAGKLDAQESMRVPSPAIAPRALHARIIRNVSSSASPGLSAIAAWQGLDLTRPYHDKRVVEFGLAIPETIQVKKGRDRLLALKALPDIYPAEFWKRDWRSDTALPDFDGMMVEIADELRSQTGLMSQNTCLAARIDTLFLERALAPLPAGRTWAQSRDHRCLSRALMAYLVGKQLLWLKGHEPLARTKR